MKRILLSVWGGGLLAATATAWGQAESAARHIPSDREKVATFSIVAADPESGICGAAVASKYPAVGRIVPYARAGAGAFCTQHHHVPEWGARALDLLAAGHSPQGTLDCAAEG